MSVSGLFLSASRFSWILLFDRPLGFYHFSQTHNNRRRIPYSHEPVPLPLTPFQQAGYFELTTNQAAGEEAEADDGEDEDEAEDDDDEDEDEDGDEDEDDDDDDDEI